MIIKDKVYTKWVYDYLSELSNREELRCLELYEYRFNEYPDDVPQSWFVEVGDSEDDDGLYNARDLFDTKEECIVNAIDVAIKCIDHYKSSIIRTEESLEYLRGLLE